jgi:hypothetical protein
MTTLSASSGCLDNNDSNLCETICRPGGHFPNPAFVAGRAEPLAIPCTGIMVSHPEGRDQHAVGLAHHGQAPQPDQLNCERQRNESDLGPETPQGS